jgi:hypothetical protein
MGANATTSVPTYVAGDVLTAANLNVTNSGIPVFANASARTAAFGGTGEKTLAEGQYAYLEDDNKTYVYDGAAWQEVANSGLVLISSTTIGTAVSSVTVSSAFSSTYDNYKITIAGGAASTGLSLYLQLGATTSAYYMVTTRANYATPGTFSGLGDNNAAQWSYAGNASANGVYMNVELNSPNLAKRTYLAGWEAGASGAGAISGFLDNTTAYTAFTITTSTGTLTGGTIRVYGYKN